MSEEEPTTGSPIPEADGEERPEGEGDRNAEPRPPRANDWRQTGLALLVLLSGIVIGGSGAVIIGKQMLVNTVARGPDDIPGEVVGRIAMDLRLSPDQMAQVHDIVSRRMRRVDEIRVTHLEDISRQFDLMRDEIADVLPADQARMWRQRFEEARRLGFSGPPQPGPWGGPGGPGPQAAPGRPGGPDFAPHGPGMEGKGPAPPLGPGPGR